MVLDFTSWAKKNDNVREMDHSIFHVRASKVPLDLHLIRENSANVPMNTPFFHFWLLIGYYGLCIPFQPAKKLNSAFYELQTNKLQKVLVFTFSVNKLL